MKQKSKLYLLCRSFQRPERTCVYFNSVVRFAVFLIKSKLFECFSCLPYHISVTKIIINNLMTSTTDTI